MEDLNPATETWLENWTATEESSLDERLFFCVGSRRHFSLDGSRIKVVEASPWELPLR